MGRVGWDDNIWFSRFGSLHGSTYVVVTAAFLLARSKDYRNIVGIAALTSYLNYSLIWLMNVYQCLFVGRIITEYGSLGLLF